MLRAALWMGTGMTLRPLSGPRGTLLHLGGEHADEVGGAAAEDRLTGVQPPPLGHTAAPGVEGMTWIGGMDSRLAGLALVKLAKGDDGREGGGGGDLRPTSLADLSAMSY